MGFKMGAVFVFSLVLTFLGTANALRINDNGGYEDLIVAIDKDVPSEACSQLIPSIQVRFTTISIKLDCFFLLACCPSFSLLVLFAQ